MDCRTLWILSFTAGTSITALWRDGIVGAVCVGIWIITAGFLIAGIPALPKTGACSTQLRVNNKKVWRSKRDAESLLAIGLILGGLIIFVVSVLIALAY